MAEKQIIETIGSISKEETVATLKHDILSNTFVLEIQDPFPGYHGQLPPSDKEKSPNAVLFVLKSWTATETVFRAEKNIKKYFNMPFEAAAAEISINNLNYHAIRIKGVRSFTYLNDLQQCFRDEGFSFAKLKTVHNKCIMKIKKHLLIEQITPNIYISADSAKAYLEIPVCPSWKHFEEITLSIRRNIDYKTWDAALASIWRKSGLIDAVRIYDPNYNIENLKLVHEKYLIEIKRFYA